jgi:4'-phosphopantetheinyl transferase
VIGDRSGNPPGLLSWSSPPSSLSVDDSAIHIWRAHLDLPTPLRARLEGSLDVAELERANRYHSNEHRDRYIACRAILRAILGRYPGLDPRSVEFEYGKYGKPEIKSGAVGLKFSVSHSHDLALYALTWRRGIGVDVEHLRPVPLADKIVESYFTPRERAAYVALSPEKRQAAFFHAWTGKEACLKAIGVGLSAPLQSVEVLFGAEDAVEVRWLERGSEKVTPWIVHAFEPKRNYAAAVAVKGSGCRLRFWEWGTAVAKPTTGAQTGESCSAIYGRSAAPEGSQ